MLELIRKLDNAKVAETWGRAATASQAANRIVMPDEAREHFLKLKGPAPTPEENEDSDDPQQAQNGPDV